jgi:hypothetical protein
VSCWRSRTTAPRGLEVAEHVDVFVLCNALLGLAVAALLAEQAAETAACAASRIEPDLGAAAFDGGLGGVDQAATGAVVEHEGSPGVALLDGDPVSLRPERRRSWMR